MAGGSLYRDDDEAGAIADINVTPLVDITLVLLIIFMVTARLIAERGIQVESPKTASGSEVASSLQITIDRDRQLYVNGTKYADADAAKAVVAQMRAGDPDLKAIITADTNVPHGEVMKVIDFVKLAGVTKFALTSDPLSASASASAPEPAPASGAGGAP